MRFSIAAIALFAGAALAQVTVTSTDIETITSCAPSVTNCPARQTATSAPAIGVSPVAPAPVPSNSAVPSVPVVPAPAGTTSTWASVAPLSTSVITVTTCVPTTSLSTITFSAAPTSVVPVGTGSPLPVSSGVAVPSASAVPAYHNAGNAVTGSFMMAGAAAVAAVLLA